MSYTRKANYINMADLYRSEFAAAQAKRMMGVANPITGADIRKPGSTNCSSCGKWHRPGNICPATKSFQETEREHPGSLHAENLLSFQPEKKDPKEHHEQAEDFVDQSNHLQAQQENYYSKLREWQSRYISPNVG